MAISNENNTGRPARSEDSTIEKGFSNGVESHDNLSRDDALRLIRTAGSVAMSPELFEKLYLSPQNKVEGHLRTTFGNPTPLALIGFLLSLTPFACDLMGWRGAGGGGAASIGMYYSFGGILMILGGIGEWILGNTFPFVVFSSFGAFWVGFAITLTPSYNAYGAYSPDPTNPAAGLATVGFNSSFAFVCVSVGLLCFIYLICAFRINVAFVMIFATILIAFGLLAGAYFQVANGNIALAGQLQVAGGAFLFATCACGWWVLAAIMFATMEFPIQLPVGDLTPKPKHVQESSV